MKTLISYDRNRSANPVIIYYSYGGNTRKIAETLQKKIGCDIAEIETVNPYTGDYNAVVEQGQREVNSGYMPEIKPVSADISAYDRILLGTPVWWYTFAPAVKTFFSQYDLSGKEVHPFITNGGWIGHTVKDIEKSCPAAKIGKAVNIKFDGNKMAVSASEIEKWAENIMRGD